MRFTTAVLFVFILLLYAGCPKAVLGAQEEAADEPIVRVVVMPKVKVYVAPPENGTEKEVTYFLDNFKMELVGAAYAVVETKEESDFYMALSINHYEGEDNELTVTLFDTETNHQIVSLSYGYAALSDMNIWNLYIIFQAMANAPIVKLRPNAELEGVLEGVAAKPNEMEPYKAAFYAGLRVSGLLNLYTFQTLRDYVGGGSQSISGEGAVLLEFHPFRYFSVQAEAGVTYERFGELRGGEAHSQGIGSALSLHIPLLIKAPIILGGLFLSPFAGVYYILPLWMRMEAGTVSTKYPYRVNPPLGISFGVDMGKALGPGKFFIGVRYDRDLGTTIGENEESPFYFRTRLGLTVGYAFGGGKK
jgi:hypothetical protein